MLPGRAGGSNGPPQRASSLALFGGGTWPKKSVNETISIGECRTPMFTETAANDCH